MMHGLMAALLLCMIVCPVDMTPNHGKSGIRNEDSSKNLRISLESDKETYSIGDEIHFRIEMKNAGDFPVRVLIDDAFVGSNIECSDVRGTRYAYEGGYDSWSPKAGVYTGRTFLIQPDRSMEIRLDALVFDDYSLIFSNQFDRKGGSRFPELKRKKNLPGNFPDKYICAGRIFRLPGAGKYRFAYLYQATENDRNWKFAGAKTAQEASTDLLWIGRTVSNVVELIFK